MTHQRTDTTGISTAAAHAGRRPGHGTPQEPPAILAAVGTKVTMGLQDEMPEATVAYDGWDLTVDNRGVHYLLCPADWSVAYRAHVRLEMFEAVPTGLPTFTLDHQRVVRRMLALFGG